MTSAVPFMDLRPGEDAEAVRVAIDRVVHRGFFVLGPELDAFESEFAAASGAEHAVGVANGTDAIALLLRAAGVRPGDEVIVPAMTAAYSALAVMMAGATPVFCDIDPVRLTMSAPACAAAITSRSAAILPVHLYGQPAELSALRDVAQRHGLLVIEDCCQAHLATCDDVPVGTSTTGGAFSFYPTKNLGALGDAGAVLTNDAELAARVRRLRNGGQTDRYHHVEAGWNSRLDEIQAAVLRARLPFLASWTATRRARAAEYRAALAGSGSVPDECDRGHAYHLFPVFSPERDALRRHLAASGVETLVHYPVPLPEQAAFAGLRPAAYQEAARVAREALSLPLNPRLTSAQVSRVAEAVTAFQKGRAFA